MGRYDSLRDYLKEHGGDGVSLSFAEIESIIGGALPPSASRYDAWWANTGDGSAAGHSHAGAWQSAGYRARVHRGSRTVRFYRDGRDGIIAKGVEASEALAEEALPAAGSREAVPEQENRQIALIACSKLKKNCRCRASELYSPSTLFSLSYRYARQNADRVYILSSKYGLVGEDEVLEPYDETLNEKSAPERKAWAERVLDQLRRVCDPDRDEFIILAGKHYYENLLPHLARATLPLGNLSMGRRIEFLQRKLEGADGEADGTAEAFAAPRTRGGKTAMRAAIIGAGFIAEAHAQVLREMGVEIALVVAGHGDTARSFAGRYGCSRYSTDFRDALALGCDCVHICTPPALHEEEILPMLEAGVAVFAEKPLCPEPEAARRLARAARQMGVPTGMDFNVRFHKGVAELRERLRGEAFGPLRLVRGAYLQEFHALPCPYGWRYDERQAGPARAITELGSHWMDLLEYVTGRKILRLGALAATPRPWRRLEGGVMFPGTRERHDVEVRSEDAVTVQLEMEGGVIGSFMLSEISPGSVNALSLELTGDRQTLAWDSEDANALRVGSRGAGTQVLRYPFEGGFVDTQRALLRAFYDDLAAPGAAAGGYPTFEDGARSAELCAALLESARRGGMMLEVGDHE